MSTIPLTVADGFITKPRSDSASSRNDLFNTSWAPEVRPPKPLSLSPVAGPSTFPRTKKGLGFKLAADADADADDSTGNQDTKGVTEFGTPVTTSTTQVPETRVSRTSSFFDTSSSDYSAPVPPPRPPTFPSGPPSPLSLSRSSSLRNRPPPLPLDFSTGTGTGTNTNTTNNSSLSSSVGTTSRSYHQIPLSVQHVHPRTPPIDSEPLSPLHQSPSLPPIGDWTPPQPPSSEDITLRLNPRSAFLLGEGRYATVFLGSYKRERKAKTKNPNPFLAYTKPRITRTPSYEDAGAENRGGADNLPQSIAELEVNDEKDGYAGGSWRLCAAKRMAPDRQSQTMGLREAFFLNRLAGPGSGPVSPMSTLSLLATGSSGRDTNHNGRPKTRRAVSPLREKTTNATATTSTSSRNRSSSRAGSGNGSVYVVKLIAVKEDSPARLVGFNVAPQGHGHPPGHPSGSGPGHGRSASDAITETKTGNTTTTTTQNQNPSSNSRGLVRQRSSTMMNRTLDRDGKPMNDSAQYLTSLHSFPSLPSLVQAAQGDLPRNIQQHQHQHQQQYRHVTTPALSRLVLILEHAPLGTMDRLLRTSPGLVGKALWQRWAIQTTEALQWVHGKGIVHADIKAGNLLLTADLDIRLSDFGSSLLIHPSHPPTDGVGLGTLPFSPPELVDPDRSFSFPVDIFSLGATLYQCITGREPFRGCRTIEMMHHVRKGGLWAWEERERLLRIGQEREDNGVVPSPYPSAWRAGDHPAQGAGVGAGVLPSLTGGGGGIGGIRRSGSLRVPNSHNHNSSPGLGPIERPVLGRMSSTESLRASEDTGHVDSPPGVKLWGKWISKLTSKANKRHSSGGNGTDPVSLLLAEEDDHTIPSNTTRTPTTLRVDTSSSISPSASISNVPSRNSPGDSTSSSQVSPIIPFPVPIPHPDPTLNPEPTTVRRTPIMAPSYNDGSPAMFFLGGDERVDEQVREVLRSMLQSREESRPTADQLRAKWEELGVEQ